MPRKKRCRRIEKMPECKSFGPLEDSMDFEKINLTIVELEAIRLKDIEKLTQEECASKMEVSRQTFQNILNESREKIARALLEGCRLDINGGNYRFKKCKMKCEECAEK